MGEKHDVVESGPGVLSSDSSATVELERKGPPNGGSKAWLQILGAFFLYFNTWGKKISRQMQSVLAPSTFVNIIQELSPALGAIRVTMKTLF